MDIYSDGGARGNPGPAACAFVVLENGKVIHKDSKFLGKATNNQAEYQGVILALNYLITQSTNLQIRFFLDSELVAKQLTGLYRVKDSDLKKLFLEIQKILEKISGKIIFKNIPRTKNKLADFLVNKTLDMNQGYIAK